MPSSDMTRHVVDFHEFAADLAVLIHVRRLHSAPLQTPYICQILCHYGQIPLLRIGHRPGLQLFCSELDITHPSLDWSVVKNKISHRPRSVCVGAHPV